MSKREQPAEPVGTADLTNDDTVLNMPDPTELVADAMPGSPKGGSTDPGTTTGPGRYGGGADTPTGQQGSLRAETASVHHGPPASPDQPPASTTHGGSSPALSSAGALSHEGLAHDADEGGSIGGLIDASDPESAAQARDVAHAQGGTWGVEATSEASVGGWTGTWDAPGGWGRGALGALSPLNKMIGAGRAACPHFLGTYI